MSNPFLTMTEDQLRKCIAENLTLIMQNNITFNARKEGYCLSPDVIINLQLADRTGAIINAMTMLGKGWSGDNYYREIIAHLKEQKVIGDKKGV